MSINRDYLGFLTSQYQNSTKFLTWFDELVLKSADAVAVNEQMDLAFDLDSAFGAQLDTLGVIIGLARGVRIPITGVFFCFYTPAIPATEDLGWEMGSWRDPHDPGATEEMNLLPDDAYRQLLKFKVIQNSWPGTAEELYHAWETQFASDGIVLDIIDNQNMSAMFRITGPVIPAATQYILLNNYIPMKPCGVDITYDFNEGSP
jgi:hypothetical protein